MRTFTPRRCHRRFDKALLLFPLTGIVTAALAKSDSGVLRDPLAGRRKRTNSESDRSFSTAYTLPRRVDASLGLSNIKIVIFQEAAQRNHCRRLSMLPER